MILLSGILCLIAAGLLLFQIRAIQDKETNQPLQKFSWLYWSILTITGIHHVGSAFAVKLWVSDLILTMNPLLDCMHGVTGLIFSLYLSSRKQRMYEK